MIRALALAMGLAATSPAAACMMMAQMKVEDVRLADTVILGNVTGYEIVDVGARGPLPNYARFTVTVDQVLSGSGIAPGKIITFTWDNSTFGEPEDWPDKDGVIFALRRATSPLPPLRGPSATILPAPEPNGYTILQAPCAPALIFGRNDRGYDEVLRMLAP